MNNPNPVPSIRNHLLPSYSLAQGSFEMLSEVRMKALSGRVDFVAFGHLRWDYAFNRPQHLLSRFANLGRVFYIEDPLIGASAPYLSVHIREGGVRVVVPHFPSGLSSPQIVDEMKVMLDEFFEDESITRFNLWYYTPTALAFSRHLNPISVIYDCLGEGARFKNAATDFSKLELELVARADLVFTASQSLLEQRQGLNPNMHAFPNPIECTHFKRARDINLSEPADQARIIGKKIGYFGVIDERVDLKIFEGVARLRPDWHLIALGPVGKIDPDALPRVANIHYLGSKDFQILPAYLGRWDLAILPLAKNSSTQFVGADRAPEYLAAGKPVVATSIRDIVHLYAKQNLVSIADTAEDFVRAAEGLMTQSAMARRQWLSRVDHDLANKTWDQTWMAMSRLVHGLMAGEIECNVS